MLIQECQRNKRNIKIFFIESICDDVEVVEQNIADVTLNSPDYEGSKHDETVNSFYKRIENYEKHYVTLDELEADENKSFIKIFNGGQRYLINNISGKNNLKIIGL